MPVSISQSAGGWRYLHMDAARTPWHCALFTTLTLRSRHHRRDPRYTALGVRGNMHHRRITILTSRFERHHRDPRSITLGVAPWSPVSSPKDLTSSTSWCHHLGPPHAQNVLMSPSWTISRRSDSPVVGSTLGKTEKLLVH